MAAAQKRQEEKHVKILRDLVQTVPENRKCFDCTSKNPTYVNLFNYTFICATCAGINRELNLGRVKSISASSFTPQEIKSLQDNGNAIAAKIWLANWNAQHFSEPLHDSEPLVRREYLRKKYVRKEWYSIEAQRKLDAERQAAQNDVGAAPDQSRPGTLQRPPQASTSTIPRSVSVISTISTAPQADPFASQPGHDFMQGGFPHQQNAQPQTETNPFAAMQAQQKRMSVSAKTNDGFPATFNAEFNQTTQFQADFSGFNANINKVDSSNPFAAVQTNAQYQPQPAKQNNADFNPFASMLHKTEPANNPFPDNSNPFAALQSQTKVNPSPFPVSNSNMSINSLSQQQQQPQQQQQQQQQQKPSASNDLLGGFDGFSNVAPSIAAAPKPVQSNNAFNQTPFFTGSTSSSNNPSPSLPALLPQTQSSPQQSPLSKQLPNLPSVGNSPSKPPASLFGSANPTTIASTGGMSNSISGLGLQGLTISSTPAVTNTVNKPSEKPNPATSDPYAAFRELDTNTSNPLNPFGATSSAPAGTSIFNSNATASTTSSFMSTPSSMQNTAQQSFNSQGPINYTTSSGGTTNQQQFSQTPKQFIPNNFNPLDGMSMGPTNGMGTFNSGNQMMGMGQMGNMNPMMMNQMNQMGQMNPAMMGMTMNPMMMNQMGQMGQMNPGMMGMQMNPMMAGNMGMGMGYTPQQQQQMMMMMGGNMGLGGGMNVQGGVAGVPGNMMTGQSQATPQPAAQTQKQQTLQFQDLDPFKKVGKN
ncbi:hypothetical protein BKA69DRAFT_1121121 [Paraphysoderma sedebokerense]|nr:hypothetical protein BKA69DRAFT_1121121 [Paraphysoderma sedebokerense]